LILVCGGLPWGGRAGMIAACGADWCGGWRRCPDGLDLARGAASSVPRDVVDDVVGRAGKGARRAGGKLPPHVMVYFVMALALFADVIFSLN
jgi:hypothetical protein